MVTAVLFVQQANPTTITQFHDQIMNQLPKQLPPWEFELRIFLNNKYSKPPTMDFKKVPNRYLYTLQLSYLNDGDRGNRMISIINNNKSVVTCIPNSTQTIDCLENYSSAYEESDFVDNCSSNNNDNDDENGDEDGDVTMDMNGNKPENVVKKTVKKNELDISRYNEKTLSEVKKKKKLLKHINNGCCNNLSVKSGENLEFLLVSKLQSLWTLKQTIKGQGGMGYITVVELPNMEEGKSLEKFRLRTSNCLLHGAFKGFLIEIEHLDEAENKKERKDGNTNELSETEKKNRLIMRFSNSISKIKSLIDVYKFPEGNLCFNVLSDSKLDYLSDLCQQYCDALQF